MLRIRISEETKKDCTRSLRDFLILLLLMAGLYGSFIFYLFSRLDGM